MSSQPTASKSDGQQLSNNSQQPKAEMKSSTSNSGVTKWKLAATPQRQQLLYAN
jgi:hypothetical protein